MNWFRHSLASKLILAFLTIAVTVGVLVILFVRQNNSSAFRQLVEDQALSTAQTLLTDYYSENGSWRGVEQILPAARSGQQPPQDRRPTQPRDDQRDRDGVTSGLNRVTFGLVSSRGRVIVPLPPDLRPGQQIPQNRYRQGLPITVDGEVVGYLLTQAKANPGQRPDPVLTQEERLFLERTNAAVIWATLVALLVALGLGAALTRYLLRPIRDLTAAAHNMADGNLSQQVPVRSRDELGDLALAFNRMSADLDEANRLRRQMTADIAHDLRTPLQIISGYVESIRDGVLTPTPARMAAIYTEIAHLEHLIADLRTLSRADAGELSLTPQSIDVGELFERVVQRYQLEIVNQGVELVEEIPPDLPGIWADEERVMQVLGNLVSNALRYTPAGGRITLGARHHRDGVMLWVADTGAGIAPQDLPNLFERFYRADKARNTDTGESGLGLAIVKALVEAHGGTIRAESQGVGTGATFLIWLPVSG